MRSAALAVSLLASAALTLSACSGLKSAFGMQKVSPDEFRIVTKAPLVLPPDYSLKPPATGSQPDQSDAEGAAQSALLGEASSAFTPGMTSGERSLLSTAGAQYSDPLIRQVVDQEFASIVDKDEDLTNRLVFWSADPSERVTSEINPSAAASQVAQTQAAPPAPTPVPPPAPKPDAAVPDQVQGQPTPTIGRQRSHLLDGIF